MATITSAGNTFNTTSGTHTVVATPALNDLIIIIVANTGSVASVAPTDNNADGKGTYTKITSALKNTSADLMEVYVRNSLIGNASSTTFTHAPGTTTGGGLQVYRISGASAAGLAGIYQKTTQANVASGTPAPVFTNAVDTNHPVISAVFNGTSPGGISARTSPVYTRDTNVGYSTPTTGFDAMHINSGETATTITWASSSASAFASLAVEVNTVVTRTKTFTADGIIKATNTQTFTTDGIVEVTGNTFTFTADGLILVHNTQTFTADGIIKATNTFTFTSDGVVLVQGNIETFTADGIVEVQGNTQTFTADGIVLKTTTFTFTADGIIKATSIFTFTADGIVLVTTTNIFTADGIMLETFTKTFIADGIILKTTSLGFTSDGIILVTTLATFTSDGIILTTNTETFTADGIIIIPAGGTTKTFTTDGIILVQGNIETFTSDGIVFVTANETITADGIIIEASSSITFTADGIIKGTNIAAFTIDIVIEGTALTGPGGRVDESDWLGHSTGGLWWKVEAPRSTYVPVSPIHDEDETPRLVNKELELLDTFTSGSVN